MKFSIFLAHLRTAAQQENVPPEIILQKARAMGYEGVEDSIDFLLPQMKEVLPPLQDAGLRFSSLYTFQSFEKGFDEAALLRILDALPSFSCKKLMVVPGYFTQEHLQEVEWARFIDGLSFACEAARERGVTLSVENFGNAASPCFNLDRLTYMMDQVPLLKYTFDTGNFYFAQENPLDAFRLLHPRLAHVHLKDYNASPRMPEEGERYDIVGDVIGYSSSVGGGMLPLRECVRAIADTGYDDFLCVEQFFCAHQLKDMEASIRFVQSIL